ncbi:MAG TPA: hypothetical protein VD815_04400 [Candidatus Saccharimonadales bacterium]|nr:hypothetical protein [Candidatus Saccharimonadales bacterium]
MGSNPTPRAYLGELCDNFNSFRKVINDRTTNLAHGNIPSFDGQQQDIDYSITKRIDSLTKSCTKQYFNKILKNLANANISNANTICDYIISEETEINIKNSTKEGKIKVLVWLSNYHEDIKLFKELPNKISYNF